MEIGIKIGKDYRGDFLEHSITNSFDDYLTTVTRQYYEFVDKELLENMPYNVLCDLENKISNELKRRSE